MESITDLKICGFDEMRPPTVRKEPYIDLYFKLSHKAPDDWCTAFNNLAKNGKYSGKINAEEGLFIETWVRLPDEVAPALEALKKAVSKCSEEYMARIKADAERALRSPAKPGEEGEQGRLNKIIKALDFES